MTPTARSASTFLLATFTNAIQLQASDFLFL